MIINNILLGVAGLLSTVSAQKVISASAGTIRGETIKDGELHRFLGIPYAVAPVDKLRFTKPKKLDNFQFTFVANRTRSFCPQLLIRDSVWNNLPLTQRSDEDCLYLNIYVPERNVELPVMVFLDGDNFLTGRGDVYDGDELAINGDVIVVTLNYRLGIFGFLTIGDENAPGNIGLWDQNLALHWVQDNIGAFGGDPSRVTLVGWSAGATSAALHALSEESKGLFSRVILQGGGVSGPTPVMTKQQAVEIAKKVGTQSNCYSSDNSKSLTEMLACLQSGVQHNPTLLIIRSLTVARAVPVRGYLNAAWVPVIDGVFIKDDPAKLLSDKVYLESIGFYNLDIMLGFSRNEGTHMENLLAMFVNPRILPSIATDEGITTEFILNNVVPAIVQGKLGLESIPAQVYIESEYNIMGNYTSYADAFSLYTDSYFAAPIIEIAQVHSSGTSGTGNTYMYRFDHSASVGSADAPHGGELPYVFGLSPLVSLAYQVPQILTSGSTPLAIKEQALKDLVVNYWSNFIKTGNPNKPKLIPVNWPSYEVTTKNYMKFSLEESSADDLEDPRKSFWMDCFPLNPATLSKDCPTYPAIKRTTTSKASVDPVISGGSPGPSSKSTTKHSPGGSQATTPSKQKATNKPVTPVTSGGSPGPSSKSTTKQSSGSSQATTPTTQKATNKPVTRKPQQPLIIIEDRDNSCNSLKANIKTIFLFVSSLFFIQNLVRF